jgi:aspartyl-tRNA synthetase|tara:strand:+ start:4736 stop:6487 length:1752 start_codon:yes stop_codon:yes gene_type:complete
MYRTHTCGELRLTEVGQSITLSGWVQRRRDFGGLSFIDLRDRYGITQLAFNEGVDADILSKARLINRESVIQAEGIVVEREKKNKGIETGEIEIRVTSIKTLSSAKTPPFTIEENTDGGDDLRMKYRYLDLRRKSVLEKLLLRNKISMLVRTYLNLNGFADIETPYLIKSTPEGARDFVVPSRVNRGQFYALPQSPQTFKQLLMIGGLDKYYQIVRCFRDEDLRADRQPEFTQIDCEMSFIEQDDILNVFEGLLKHVIKEVHSKEIGSIPKMTYATAIKKYGNDKPDIRFDMTFVELNELVKGSDFPVFNNAELIVGINVKGCADYSRKELDTLTSFVKRPQLGMSGLIWMKVDENGIPSSSVKKFFDQSELKKWMTEFDAEKGDLVLILAGEKTKTRKALSETRMHLAEKLGLRKPMEFAPLWVVDFPLLERDEDNNRWMAMHHPFTSPKPEDLKIIDSNPGAVRANAYDLVLNGNEIGGGSIRIHEKKLQSKMFDLLGFTESEANEQFGFLMNAFEYGAPPHGGIAFGFDRLVAIMGGDEVIRDYIAFPKNNSARDVMIEAPSQISDEQLEDLSISIKLKD